MTDWAGIREILTANIRQAMDDAEARYRAASPAKKFEIDRKRVAMQKWQDLWSAHVVAGGDSRDSKFWKNWRGIEVSDGEVREYRDEMNWSDVFSGKPKKKSKVKHRVGKTVFVHMNGYPEDDGTGCPLEDRTF